MRARTAFHPRTLATWLLTAAIFLTTTPAFAADVFINGLKATNLKLAELLNCTVKFDGEGNIHILSPGYNVTPDKDGNPKLSGSSDFAGNPLSSEGLGKTKSRYVLVYQPNVKVNARMEVFVNGRSFKKIGPADSGFTIDLTQELRPGYNDIRVVGRVERSPEGGTESDVAMVKVLTGREVEGKFLAKSPPVWEFVRSAIDQLPLDRTGRFTAE